MITKSNRFCPRELNLVDNLVWTMHNICKTGIRTPTTTKK